MSWGMLIKKTTDLRSVVFEMRCLAAVYASYSCHDLILMSSWLRAVKASM